MVVACVALVVAMGGTGYAATLLPKNSVGTAQLKQYAVTLGKINNNARKALRGARGPQGPGAKRIWVDTKIGKPDGVVYTTPDFKITVDCEGPRVSIQRRAPANVAVTSMAAYTNDTDGFHAGQESQFLDNDIYGGDIVVLGSNDYSASATAVIQSYAPGTDTARNFTVNVTITSEGAKGKCASFGSVIPGS